MHLTDFCTNQVQIFEKQPSVIVFQSKKYAPLAFAQIISWLEQSKVIALVQALDLDQDVDQLSMMLHTSFLGQSKVFIFGDLNLIHAKKKRADWLHFLQGYQGPHQIIGWLSEQEVEIVDNDYVVTITVADTYSQDNVQLLQFLYQEQKRETIAYFFAKLFRIKREMSLEQLCLLHRYAGLVGKNMDSFFQEWCDQLMVSDVSLFYLAQLFFEKKPDLFFKYWHQIRPYFSDQFWTTYFSDQIFKAHFYVSMHGNVTQVHKQLIYGLPFSFLKHDWRWHNTDALQQAHEKLYDVDGALKNGGSAMLLDNFLIQFFV